MRGEGSGSVPPKALAGGGGGGERKGGSLGETVVRMAAVVRGDGGKLGESRAQ